MRARRWPSITAAASLAALAGVGLVAGDTPAGAPQIGGVVRKVGGSRIPLALPPIVAGTPSFAAAAAQIREVLRADLDFTGYFDILDNEGETRVAPGQENDPQAWGAVGADYVVQMALTPDGDKTIFRARVLHTHSTAVPIDRKWAPDLGKDVRRAAHVVADAITQELTGQKGIALTRLAFVSAHGAGKEVYLMDYDGAQVSRLTTTGTINLVPVWSPDARRLAFVSFFNRKPSFYLLDDTGSVKTIQLAGGDLNIAPSFSPDGQKIAFSSDRDDNSEIYVYDLATGRETRITRNPGIDTSPSWSPNGEEIAFTSDRTGSPQIYLMRADGTNVRRLTFQGNYNESAAWSPDGKRIAFVSRLEGRFQVLLHILATGEERQITSGGGNKENPRWAPDNRHLVFASDMHGPFSIYTMRDDGTDIRQLTKGVASITPDWSPLRR